jgi:hypothetical protein
MNLEEYFAAANDAAIIQGPPPRHILVYGPPKSGKTAAVGALAAKFHLYYIDDEDSVKTLGNPDMLPVEYRKNIDLIRIPDKQTYPMAIETVLKIIKGGKSAVCHAHGKVNCPVCTKAGAPVTIVDIDGMHTARDILVIDSQSRLAESAMNYIMRDSIAKDNWDAKAGWDEYGKQGRILERINSTIQVAPFNVVVISHEMMVEMEDKENKIVPVCGTTNNSKLFGKYFDDIIYCEIVNRKHKFTSTTTGKPNVLAGSRAGYDLKPGDTLLKLFEPRT